jgi:hypothetical protein
MDCPSCNKSIVWQPEKIEGWSEEFDDESINEYALFSSKCPACDKKIIVFHTNFKRSEDNEYGHPQYTTYKENEETLYPKGTNIKDIDHDVPENYKKEFIEASRVAKISPKASAALSRRLLQQILREELKIKKQDLNKEIEEFIKTSNATETLKKVIDAIRNIGNFAAHPLKSTSTGEIVEVEPGEAEWLLEILDMLFNHTFIQPKREQRKIEKLNAKLRDYGKPPMK